MQQLLAAMAVDLRARSVALIADIEANNDPDLDDQRTAALEHLRELGDDLDALPAPAEVPADGEGVQLRRLARLTRDLDGREWRLRGVLARYGPPDRLATAQLRGLLQEAGWHDFVPAVQTWSKDYYWATAHMRLVGVPPGEQDRILRLPDLCHEFGHCLHHERGSELSLPLLGDLMLWSAADRAETVFRNEVFRNWANAWLAEFTCDAIGCFLTGDCYAKQHLALCARRGADPYQQTSSHPADHARAGLIAATLDCMGLGAAAADFRERWNRFCGVLEQPVPDGERRLGRTASKDPDFWERYPSDQDGSYLERVAAKTVEGMRGLGMQTCPEDPAPESLRGLLAEAWRLYEADPEDFVQLEPELMDQLRARLG